MLAVVADDDEGIVCNVGRQSKDCQGRLQTRVSVMPDTHRRRRREETVESRRVGGVNTLPTQQNCRVAGVNTPVGSRDPVYNFLC